MQQNIWVHVHLQHENTTACLKSSILQDYDPMSNINDEICICNCCHKKKKKDKKKQACI